MNLQSPILKVTLFCSAIVVGFVLTVGVRFANAFIASDTIPVALTPGNVDSPKASPKESIQISLQWGGYYATKHKSGYRVFRLIDLTPDTLHTISYSETFREIPHLSQVIYLVPTHEHLAEPAVDILGKKPILIGNKPLSLEDLIPYSQHLNSKGIHGGKLMRFTNRVVRLSYDTPLLTKLVEKEGLLKFEQP